MLKQADILRSLVDRRTGIITAIDYVPPLEGGPNIHTYRGHLCTPNAFIDNKLIKKKNGSIFVSGCDLNKEAALWSMLGEGVERYAAYAFDSTKVIISDYKSISDIAVNPLEWIGFDSNFHSPDLSYQPFSPGSPIRWVWANCANDDSQILIPAVHVWLWLGTMLPAENFVQKVSTGLGAGSSAYQAKLSGLLEVIERDAFSSRWMLSACPMRLSDTDDLNTLLGEKQFSSGIEAQIYDISIENIVPVVLAKLTLPHLAFGFCLGASAALLYETAIQKALLEAYHILQGLIFWQNEHPADLLINDVNDFVDHGRFYSQKSQAEQALWFFNNQQLQKNRVTLGTDVNNENASIDRIVQDLAKCGYKTYFVNLTPPDIQELGFYVFKALVPGLQPLTCGHQVVADEQTRLIKVAQKLHGTSDFNINRQLQPFA